MRISDVSSDVCSSDLYGDRAGRPDGCTVDAEGHLWIAEVTASRVSRYRPDATLERSIELPLSKPTSEIGRASCRERVCQYVSISVVAVSLTTTTNNVTSFYSLASYSLQPDMEN